MARADAEWEARRQEQRKSYDALMQNVPLLEKSHPRDVLQLNVEDRILTLRTPLPTTPGDGYARVKLPGLEEFALVRVQGGADAATSGPLSPANFQFTLNDYSRRRQISTLSVSGERSYLTISKSIQLPEGYSNVQFIERMRTPGCDHSASVQLVVSENGIGYDPPFSMSIEAPDFFALLRGYPEECHLWLRPLLRELGQEHAMAPDPMIAWQVFADQWKPDPKIQQDVQELLPKLGDDHYLVRENATVALENLGRPGAAVMVHLDRQTMTAEQRARVDRALASYAQLTPAEVNGLRRDLMFLIDCLYCDERPLREAAVARIRELTDPNLQFDLTCNGEARTNCVARIRDELTSPHPHLAPTELTDTRSPDETSR